MVGIELIGGGAFLFHPHAHLLKLLQDEVYTLIDRNTMPQQAVYGF